MFIATPKDEDLSTSCVSTVTTDNERRHEILHEDSKIDVKQKNNSEFINSPSDELNEGECTAVDNNTKGARVIMLNKDLDSGKQDEKDIVDYDKSASSYNDQEDTSKISPAEVKYEGDSSSRKSDSSDSGSWIRVLDKEGNNKYILRQLTILVKTIYNHLLWFTFTIAFCK